jgi:hypothetical protein
MKMRVDRQDAKIAKKENTPRNKNSGLKKLQSNSFSPWRIFLPWRSWRLGG